MSYMSSYVRELQEISRALHKLTPPPGIPNYLLTDKAIVKKAITRLIDNTNNYDRHITNSYFDSVEVSNNSIQTSADDKLKYSILRADPENISLTNAEVNNKKESYIINLNDDCELEMIKRSTILNDKIIEVKYENTTDVYETATTDETIAESIAESIAETIVEPIAQPIAEPLNTSNILVITIDDDDDDSIIDTDELVVTKKLNFEFAQIASNTIIKNPNWYDQYDQYESKDEMGERLKYEQNNKNNKNNVIDTDGFTEVSNQKKVKNINKSDVKVWYNPKINVAHNMYLGYNDDTTGKQFYCFKKNNNLFKWNPKKIDNEDLYICADGNLYAMETHGSDTFFTQAYYNNGPITMKKTWIPTDRIPVRKIYEETNEISQTNYDSVWTV